MSANYPEILVIDELIVGPVQLEKRRLVMPYTVVRGEERSTQELIYKYEEDVFDPQEATARNLASIIGAQPALNYGLFCRTITFDGLYNATDQRFLIDMLDNTSREIFINKFFHPNVFLRDEACGLTFHKLKRYTQARVRFHNTAFAEQQVKWSFWPSERHRHCVLSSGGKDSLLSYGLLKESGAEVYPIFGNESGRHWFTALNAYRYLKANEPNTGRVWMNSDRLFSWMLRQLSFVRPDFAQVRADYYPIRLWTVAVFSFGVLPLLRKHRIGRLIIGDEYDTTQRLTYEGVTHYNGLFDQSRFFDEAMSRFFLKKGWAISQFSILRSLSEILIQKILTNRYGELQQQQVSCHAAHEEEGRIYPCGKCEKCRRIVGMLTVLDADPQRCGYTEQQIVQCRQALDSQKLKMLAPDAAQLQHMLHERGIISREGRPHPEIMQLRFDRERSHIDGMPLNLRRTLYGIFLEHAAGAVRRISRKWQAFDLISDPLMHAPYLFEMQSPPLIAPAETTEAGSKRAQDKFRWAELTWQEAEERLRQVDIALLPVGAIEQHGPHLPLDVDAFDADYLARRVAEACSEPRPLVLPLVPYGVSYHHDDFPGTISISNEAMSRYIYDIGMSVARYGIRKLIIINGHGDNAPTLNYAAQMINRDAGIFVAVDTGETSDADIDPLSQTPNDVHAGEIETSTTLAVRPELVYMDRAADRSLNFSNNYLNFSSKNSLPWYVRTHLISEDGTLGDPTKATTEKGRRIWEIMIAHLVNFVEALKGLSLEEIYQRKY